MIIREWRGRAEPSKLDAYIKHFRNVVIPELQEVKGFVGAFLSKHQAGDFVEFVVTSRWESMDAIKGFAGDDVEKAVVEPGAVAALHSYDKTVQHFEVIEDVRAT